MLFNSFKYFIFLLIFFVLYWFVTNKKLKVQNILILIASYIFYGWWDYRFLSLLLISTVIDYSAGILIFKSQSKSRRKIFLALSLISNLGILCYFKYANFFIESWSDAWAMFGIKTHVSTLQIILPVGISFYTFQTMSYAIDIYRKSMPPTKDFIAFAAYVSFFPQLVAGPIERAINLLPQIERPRTFQANFALDGLYLILWGLFQKMVIADNCAIYVNEAYNDLNNVNPGSLIYAVFYFALQLYGDFSGYSYIAIGTARLLGFTLMENFYFPYFSRSIPELWRRWHISLTTWFRDYIFFPLGGSRVNKIKAFRNIFIVFIISGLWHGAKWTFVVWGVINSLFFIPVILFKNVKNTKKLKSLGLRYINSIYGIILTFIIFSITLVLFRSETMKQAYFIFKKLFTEYKNIDLLVKSINTKGPYLELFPLIILFFYLEYYHYKNGFKYKYSRALFLFFSIFFFGNIFNPSEFIYFQF